MSEVMEQSSALATVDPTNLALIYAADNGIETTLARIEREAREQAALLDISTKRNRDAIKSLAHKVARSKTAMDDAGASVKAEWLAKSNGIDAQRRSVRSRLDALKAEILSPVEEYEAKIAARIKANEDAIAAMQALTAGLSDLAQADINERRANLKIVAEFDWLPEFAAKAESIRAGVAAQLLIGLQEATQREIDAKAEAERVAEQAERDRLAAIEAQRQREEQIARDAAEAARVAAEAEADRKAQEAQRRAQEERDAAAERERQAAEALAAAQRQAEQEREVAQQVAARAEAARVKGHQDALETMRRLAEPLTPPDAVAVIDAKIARLVDVYDREWEEFDVEATLLLKAGSDTLTEARAVSVRVAEEAEAKRQAAEIERQERQQAAAVEAERRRVEEAKRAADAEAARRAENVAHRRKINSEALADIMKVMPEIHSGNLAEAETIAKAIIAAIAKFEVRHVTVAY